MNDDLEQNALDEIEAGLDTAIETEHVNGHVVALVVDEFARNPRDNQTTLWHIAIDDRGMWRSGYSYADKADRWILPVIREYGVEQAKTELLTDEYPNTKQAYIVLPLQYVDYGSNGAHLSVDTAPDARDWEQANGLAWVTRAELLDSYNLKHRVSAKAKAAALAVLKTEVEYFSAYLAGDVYGWTVIDSHGEQVDECWGYYGDCDRAYALEQARESANAQPPAEPPFPLTA